MRISTFAANALPFLLLTATAQAQFDPDDNQDDGKFNAVRFFRYTDRNCEATPSILDTLRIGIPPLFQTRVEQFTVQDFAGSIILDAIQPGCKFEAFPAGFGFDESVKVEPDIHSCVQGRLAGPNGQNFDLNFDKYRVSCKNQNH
jgi:hypothetical protein